MHKLEHDLLTIATAFRKLADRLEGLAATSGYDYVPADPPVKHRALTKHHHRDDGRAIDHTVSILKKLGAGMHHRGAIIKALMAKGYAHKTASSNLSWLVSQGRAARPSRGFYRITP